jgi:uncharacterized membrane protein
MTRSDAKVEALEWKIGRFLRYGVFTSAFFLTLGWAGEYKRAPHAIEHFQVYRPLSLIRMVEQALIAHDVYRLLTLFGFATLIALPIIRVLLTGYLFLRNRDWSMAAMAIFVFGVLTLSFFLGLEL